MTSGTGTVAAVTFIGAGHETTANALVWTLFLLAEFPWAYDRLAREVDTVLDGHMPTAADMPKLVFTRMVIEEAMRPYPPVPFLSRYAVGPDRLGDVEIRPRSHIVVAPWVVHRHRLLWEEPTCSSPSALLPTAARRCRGSLICPSVRARASASVPGLPCRRLSSRSP